MVEASVVENRNGSCGTLAIWARSHVRSSVRTSCPSTNTVPAGGSNSRGRRASAVLLPEAVRPTSATVVPAGAWNESRTSAGPAGPRGGGGGGEGGRGRAGG